MKKYIFLVLQICLITLCSCQQKNKTYIECTKVSCVENLETSSLQIYINIYTTLDITSLKIDQNKYIDNAKLTYFKQTTYIFNDNNQDAYIYQFLITFKKEQFTLTKLDLISNIDYHTLEIGLYQTTILKNDIEEIKVTTNISNNKIIIYIHNLLDRTIYLTNIKNHINTKTILSIDKLPISDAYIYSDATKKISVITIEYPKNYHTVSGIIKLEFSTNLKKYIIYTTYHDNRSQEVIKLVPTRY